MRNSPAPLTQKQQRFVAEYMVDGNGARAAVAAGYGVAGARVRAHRLTRDNVAVMAEIEARQAADRERLELDRGDVIAGLLEAIAQARAQGNPMALIAGWRELGKLLGYYEPQRHAVEVSAAADMGAYEAMSDAELMAVMAGSPVADAVD